MLAIIAVSLAAVSLVLHVVAPRTKTKVDDKARDVVDFAKDKVLPVVGGVLPNDKTPKAVTGFEVKGSDVRDHRTK